jgi:dipeptidyl aminopeptidase/acylaminoacyl peptidase
MSDTNFKNPISLTDANPQQKDINWGYTELITWISLDGIELEGVIYYPENFDPTQKYPMIVNFYERNSDNLYSHRTPEPHRSTIDYHFYTSNGYIVFNPDIIYKDGYPGLSAYNCIMPGITSILNRGFVDVNKIGAQGHSWGGYQVAYLATRTDLFAAIESGAPVVNMFSAYGGMRWGSGRNRSMQYEHQQSRIGGTIWEKPLQYLENSPLFYMDKVQTPILIMHNDHDGHVPWYQGIEYFIALKRLQKPVWMLNYTGEVHWPQRYANKVDFQKRMFGFFEHYLNNKAMPPWMVEGIKATERDYDLKY